MQTVVDKIKSFDKPFIFIYNTAHN